MRKFHLLIVTLFFVQFSFAQSILSVKVIDNEKLNMPGAAVRIVPGNSTKVTNQSGSAVFQQLKAGSYTVTISYIGYQPQEFSVEVKDGYNEFTKQMSVGATVMKDLIVLGDRLKGQAKALNQQKNNLNISNVVSSDQIGRFPDANIGDALKRIPGITMQNDQ
jgi:hypothetical protein